MSTFYCIHIYTQAKQKHILTGFTRMGKKYDARTVQLLVIGVTSRVCTQITRHYPVTTHAQCAHARPGASACAHTMHAG